MALDPIKIDIELNIENFKKQLKEVENYNKTEKKTLDKGLQVDMKIDKTNFDK